MTRINMGIPPSELCDQHLLAEYRELPRMVKFCATLSPVPNVPFTLNKGHMKSCARYGIELAFRHFAIWCEMVRRGFNPTLGRIVTRDFPFVCHERATKEWLDNAAEILKPRIIERLKTMKRQPTWTNRERPEWAKF